MAIIAVQNILLFKTLWILWGWSIYRLTYILSTVALFKSGVMFPKSLPTTFLIWLDHYLLFRKGNSITESTLYRGFSLLVWLIPLKTMITLPPISHPEGWLQYSITLTLTASGSPCSGAAQEAAETRWISVPKAINSVWESEHPYEKSARYWSYFLPVRQLITSEFSHKGAIMLPCN